MQIDWITVAAQIVNFLILVWLLKRFLYGPIIKAMDEREARIAQRMQAAEKERETAAAETIRYREMQQALEERRDQMMRAAQADADGLRKSLLSEARQKVTIQREEWLADLAAERTDFLDDIRERSGEAFSQMARRALGDLAGVELDGQIVQRFQKVLQEISDNELRNIKSFASRTDTHVAVRTGFDLTAKRRNELSSVVRKLISEDAKIVFEHSPQLICGVELRAGGQVVRWSLDGYLDGLESDLREALETRVPAVASKAAE
ncbi:MAG: F0F1 ATP synthase subunit delta [Hyphomicrobiaceae bacterium]